MVVGPRTSSDTRAYPLRGSGMVSDVPFTLHWDFCGRGIWDGWELAISKTHVIINLLSVAFTARIQGAPYGTFENDAADCSFGAAPLTRLR